MSRSFVLIDFYLQSDQSYLSAQLEPSQDTPLNLFGYRMCHVASVKSRVQPTRNLGKIRIFHLGQLTLRVSSA